MKKKNTRADIRKAAQQAAERSELNRRIQFAATHTVSENMQNLDAALRGLDEEQVARHRNEYGTNKVTKGKKKTLPQRLAGAFINPFTAILFCLALVSTVTDMIFPFLNLFGNTVEDFDCLTVVIIVTMVLISGTLRFVQETRSGNAAEALLYNDLAAHFSGAELANMQAAYIAMFQAGWFVESMWSQTLVIHMIRTPKVPFLQSRASAPVTLLTFTGIALLTVIPFTAFGRMLGFVALPMSYFAYLIPCILLYMILATSLKKAYVRHYGELL